MSQTSALQQGSSRLAVNNWMFFESAVDLLMEHSPGDWTRRTCQEWLIDRLMAGNEVYAGVVGAELVALIIGRWSIPRKRIFIRLLWSVDRPSLVGLLKILRPMNDPDSVMEFERLRDGKVRSYNVHAFIDRLIGDTYGK